MTAWQRLAQLAEWATYPFLLLSGIFILGTSWVPAFVVPLTIRNETNQPIQVTPVGTCGVEGNKSGLPIVVSSWIPLPAGQSGAFPLQPGTFCLFVASPWVVYWLLRSLRSRFDRSAAANSPATVSPA